MPINVYWQQQPWSSALIVLSEGAADTSYCGGIDVCNLAQQVMSHLTQKQKELNDLAEGNLRVQHAAAVENTKLRKALESCRRYFQDDYMSSMIDNVLKLESTTDGKSQA